MKERKHVVMAVEDGSIAQEMEIEPGDVLLAIDGNKIEDIFDYQYLIQNAYIEMLIRKKNGEEWLLEVDKDPDEDMGITFENGLMDEYRRCSNNCIFCFIDQMPPGMRKTLYFKDDDSRLSFLQGNYVTLTNMSDYDIERIIKYRLSPINISFHTMNPQLRCRMLNNRFAGEALRKADRLFEAGIPMNGQIVLCKGINDGEELEYSIDRLSRYLPHLESVSVVPVGLSRYRQGLYPLEPFTPEDACQVIDRIEEWQKKLYPQWGLHFIHASDEWYIMAGREVPEEERYDGYLQLENGVGMTRLLWEEFRQAMDEVRESLRLCGSECAAGTKLQAPEPQASGSLSMATGRLAYPCIQRMTEEIRSLFPGLDIRLYEIRNDFFGEQITVSGLLTGQDIRDQLRGRQLGERLLLPENVLRSGERVFLDDMTVEELENALQVKIDIVKSSGRDFVNAVTGAC
ncbi:MAG: DUF512 domain-containing protein [Lachnospiraceae bacterium]|nr:DUF512 domain-containing protein [Lachnospiraceae bacterium]